MTGTTENCAVVSSEALGTDGRLQHETRQQDGDVSCPSAVDTCSSEPPQWVVGGPCRALWSEDGQESQTTVVAVNGERCPVRFSDYDNEEEHDISSLLSPHQLHPPRRATTTKKDWKPGSQCRAVYSEDGLVYPAMVLWVRGQRCCVRYDHYNNEEEHDVSSLLSPDELHGPRRAATAKKGTDGRLQHETRQQDGDVSCPSAVDTCSSEPPQWVVGGPCRALWSEDGQESQTTVVAVNGERCPVRFSDYDNEEEHDISSLLSPHQLHPPRRATTTKKDWKPGSQCRAVYSEDGLVYPAMVLWVRGQRCCVRYDHYNNEEEHDVSSLLSPDELHGPRRAATAKKSQLQFE